MRSTVSISCLMVLGLAISACQSKTEAPAPAATPAAEAAPAPAAPAPVPPPAVAEIGVPECDEYLRKYDACMEKIPADVREHTKVALDAMRDGWKRAAQTEQGKAGLAAACKEAVEMAKWQTEKFACGF